MKCSISDSNQAKFKAEGAEVQLHLFLEVGTKVVNQTLKNPLDSAAHYFLVADLMFTKNIRFLRPLDRLHSQTDMTIDPYTSRQNI